MTQKGFTKKGKQKKENDYTNKATALILMSIQQEQQEHISAVKLPNQIR